MSVVFITTFISIKGLTLGSKFAIVQGKLTNKKLKGNKMATKRKRPVRKENSFYETLSVPAGRSVSRQAVAEQTRNVSKFLTATLAAVIIVAVALTARSAVLVSTTEATPSGSIVISGASSSDVSLQSTQNIASFQSTRGDLQVQDSSRLQAYSDASNLQGNAANLQGNIPAQ